jgi:hypothetical protein
MTVQEEVTLLSTDGDSSSTVPRINVVCEYCGYVLHFSPSAVGLSLQ